MWYVQVIVHDINRWTPPADPLERMVTHLLSILDPFHAWQAERPKNNQILKPSLYQMDNRAININDIQRFQFKLDSRNFAL